MSDQDERAAWQTFRTNDTAIRRLAIRCVELDTARQHAERERDALQRQIDAQESAR